ncbi:Hypothetical predicted protein [Podarcis lilfordi]|uniref:Uncharacterized protein n=1 Tax=Podarcis lilfordi TaxID=74358 RepID=A0AA35PV73_9SAUR|nr:Hypothetical predicted protein [Podarcis lilfordi]
MEIRVVHAKSASNVASTGREAMEGNQETFCVQQARASCQAVSAPQGLGVTVWHRGGGQQRGKGARAGKQERLAEIGGRQPGAGAVKELQADAPVPGITMMVKLQLPNGRQLEVKALVDSGVSANFFDIDLAQKHQLALHLLDFPLRGKTIDG